MKIVIATLLAVVLLVASFNIPNKVSYAAEVLSLDQKIDKYALEYHVNPQVARAIISCESGGNPEAIGTMAVVGRDIGVFQINDYFHEKRTQELELNIYNVDDNLRYGMILLFEQGVTPWRASASCWKSKLSFA